MKAELPEKAYLKAFEMAKCLEMYQPTEWADIIHRGCNIDRWAEGYGDIIEHWFNNNLLWL